MTARGAKRPSPLAMRTTWRVPLSITALAGTAVTGAAPMPGCSTTSAYMPGFMRPSGLGSSMRTDKVRVSGFIISG
ncbi:hypothetical protein AUC69_11065 [Methyloceanibacter superfactus]|uniref:Uncharacterized protein n=1 Tax=Methyloceanibacter superfactus TaxID=1774969 RepID=A0A1E3VVU0_9HYPH|nr:hypothetical protein AUC69_11065 [Methyloceanibacter superfactus]